MKSLRIFLFALLISILGHLILMFGIPFLSFSPVTETPEELVIRTELKAEPPKKIQMVKSPKKSPSKLNSVGIEDANSQNSGGQGCPLS